VRVRACHTWSWRTISRSSWSPSSSPWPSAYRPALASQGSALNPSLARLVMWCVTLAGTMFLYVRMTAPGQTSPGVWSMTRGWRSRSQEPVPVSQDTVPRDSSTPAASLTVWPGRTSTPSARRTGPGRHTPPAMATSERPGTAAMAAPDLVGD